MRIEATGRDFEIGYPEVHSEFEVQAFLFSELKLAGFDARGEVQVHGLFGQRSTKASCRFDIVIFKDKQAIMVLEVKARSVKHKSGVENTRQGKRYPLFGVPVYFIYGMEDAKEFLSMHTPNIKG